ncbi:MAG: retropepsin-like aspartic protease [Pyrinomonadaceae bacterium]
MKLLRLTRYIIFTSFALLLIHARAETFAQESKSKSNENVSVAKVLENMRKAVGYNRIKNLKRGFVIEEVADVPDASGGTTRMYGSAGEFREQAGGKDARPFGFDGRYGWSIDRTGFPTPMPQRLREKLLIPAWVRSGWWLSVDAPLAISLLPDETTDARVALSLRFRHGLVGAKLFVDRATWLPAQLVVEYERGPYTLELKDYGESLGFRFPQRTTVNYRGSTDSFKIKSIAEIPASQSDAFKSPPRPDDTTFNNSLPAEVKVAQGVPFSDGSEGHYYVRPLIDGREVGWFNFDSGADMMQIDEKIADELKMPVLGKSQTRGADGKPMQVTIRQGKTFQLGRMIYKDPFFLASDLSDKNAPPGEKRAGFIGYPFFARAVVEVTGGGKRIAVYDPASYKLPKGKWQELSYIDLTPASIFRFEGNREGLFQIDTGYSGTVTFYRDFINEQKLLEGRAVKEETAIGAGGTYKSYVGTIEWFELAGQRFKNPTAGFRMEGMSREGGAGVVGRDFLRDFTIVFNYPERRIAFIR